MSDAIAWPHVKALWLADTLSAPADPVAFRLCAVMKDGTADRLLMTDTNATLLRQAAHRLSAEKDVPFDDWTRPKPPGLSPSEFFTDYLRDSLAEDDEPRLPRGGVADACFLAGDDAETFRATLAGIVFAAVGEMVREGHGPHDAKECADFCARDEQDRFRALCDANGRDRTVKL